MAGLQFHTPFIHTGKKKEKTDLIFFKYTYSIFTQFLSDCHCLLLVALSGIESRTFSSQPIFPAKSCIHYDFPLPHALYVCTWDFCFWAICIVLKNSSNSPNPTYQHFKDSVQILPVWEVSLHPVNFQDFCIFMQNLPHHLLLFFMCTSFNHLTGVIMPKG